VVILARNQFFCSVDRDGNIRDMSDGYPNEIIGIDNQREEDLLKQIKKLEDRLEEWRPLMIEAGYIDPDPLTPDQQMQETINKQNDMIQALNNAVMTLTKTVERMNDNNGNRFIPVVNRSGEEPSAEDSRFSESIERGSNTGNNKGRANSNKKQGSPDLGIGSEIPA